MGVSPVLEQAVSGRLFLFAFPLLCSMISWGLWGVNGMINDQMKGIDGWPETTRSSTGQNPVLLYHRPNTGQNPMLPYHPFQHGSVQPYPF